MTSKELATGGVITIKDIMNRNEELISENKRLTKENKELKFLERIDQKLIDEYRKVFDKFNKAIEILKECEVINDITITSLYCNETINKQEYELLKEVLEC